MCYSNWKHVIDLRSHNNVYSVVELRNVLEALKVTRFNMNVVNFITDIYKVYKFVVLTEQQQLIPISYPVMTEAPLSKCRRRRLVSALSHLLSAIVRPSSTSDNQWFKSFLYRRTQMITLDGETFKVVRAAETCF